LGLNGLSALLGLKDVACFLSQGVWQRYKDLKNIKRIAPAKPRDKVNLNYAIMPVLLTRLFAMALVVLVFDWRSGMGIIAAAIYESLARHLVPYKDNEEQPQSEMMMALKR